MTKRTVLILAVTASIAAPAAADAHGHHHHHTKHHGHHVARVHKAAIDESVPGPGASEAELEAWANYDVTEAEWDQTTREVEAEGAQPVEDAVVVEP